MPQRKHSPLAVKAGLKHPARRPLAVHRGAIQRIPRPCQQRIRHTIRIVAFWMRTPCLQNLNSACPASAIAFSPSDCTGIRRNYRTSSSISGCRNVFAHAGRSWHPPTTWSGFRAFASLNRSASARPPGGRSWWLSAAPTDALGPGPAIGTRDVARPLRQLPQLQVDLPPLDLGNAHFLPHPVRLRAILEIAQRACPAAHVERQVLLQAGLLANVLQQVLQTARRPWKQLIDGLVLFQVLAVAGDPVFRQLQLALFVAVGRTCVADEDLRARAPCRSI